MADSDELETGGSLREKLEAIATENASLRNEVAETRAEKLIASKGFTHVTPADLKGLKLDELEAKATELETQKAGVVEAAIRSAFEKKGLSGDELDAAVKELLGETPEAASASALDRIRAAGQVGGTPPSKVSTEGLTPAQKIRAGVAKANKRK